MTAHTRRSRIAILGTGGTIAGTRTGTDGDAYRPASLGIDEIIAAVPELDHIADITSEQVLQIDSANIEDHEMLALARRTSQLLAADDIDAVVITHGTDALEETAYLLHLGLKTTKPVVFVGSMRPADALSADGPRNLVHAVTVAASAQAIGMGVLAVMNDEVHTARDVTKAHSINVATLRSPHGPLGHIVNGAPVFYRAPARSHTYLTPFDIDTLDQLPKVDIVFAHANMTTAVIDALVSTGTEAIIHAGMGNGSVAARMIPTLTAARTAGVHIVRCSRIPNGSIIRNAAVPDDTHDWLVADDQNPQKARLLTALALTRTQQTRELQDIFWTY
ncbi:asparaginase [Dactylosporangium sucinum]|uniref:asparaginase n=1 Tax=Dactylosporangium sucinum TaxID=1424081 RepID=A0A917UBM8_9ACTN|nr:asparaginase [Dactylosporangium sucinum]GGM78427.1 glutaminase-asparaginase [Dactylosporangium sucinum]